ncbi:hypothetical protein NWE55_16795 (plasmid) [Myroides albus]|uniref:Uncharacterized protein n=1 Tax=Myroides odoratimimus TaxID=76832 RepID=A0AAI8C9M1_9FLAO|nr:MULTISPECIES: hypothetical protein [Myroides]ALU28481.1 hypothetical protein AS202_20090 [Myroides odoratimimus]UVD81419.1 hypothetical protein NWE55_16795 [Myroides albus]
MEIGVISYLNLDDDKAYMTCKSINSTNDKYHFRPSLVPFDICLEKLICIKMDPTIKFLEFLPDIHGKDLNFSKCKGTSKISLHHNRNLVEFLIENDIAEGYKISELEKIQSLFKRVSSFPLNYKVMIDIEKIISKYEIKYFEGGRDKPGDWSTAFISINTYRYGIVDKYLDRMFPDFNVILASGDDDMDHRFKYQILNKLRKELGEEEIVRVKKLCEDMTKNVREMALLVYNENKHGEFLEQYYRELKKEIINYYK